MKPKKDIKGENTIIFILRNISGVALVIIGGWYVGWHLPDNIGIESIGKMQYLFQTCLGLLVMLKGSDWVGANGEKNG